MIKNKTIYSIKCLLNSLTSMLVSLQTSIMDSVGLDLEPLGPDPYINNGECGPGPDINNFVWA